MTQDIARLRELSERAHERLGGVSIDRMGGDNLAVTLCSYFGNPDQEEDDNGWSEDATAGCDETLQAIRAHYQPVFDALLDHIAELEVEGSLLSAGACINPGQHGLVGDEYGNGVCTAHEALVKAERERDEALARIEELQHEAELFDADHADQNRMVDRIADLIGLPHDQELDTTAFELWFSAQGADLETACARIRSLETALNRGRHADEDCPIAAHLDDVYQRSDDDQDKMHLAMAAYELRRGPFDHPDHFGCEIEADELRERIGALASAVKNILPIGDPSKPDSAVFPIYVRMSELRAIHALARVGEAG